MFTIQNRKVSSSAPSAVGDDFYELDAVVSMKTAEHDPASVIKQDEDEEQGNQGRDAVGNSTASSLSSLLEESDNDPNHNLKNKNSTKESADNLKRGGDSGISKKEVLVVFDRSDPEFESDSDPDDDLDL